MLLQQDTFNIDMVRSMCSGTHVEQHDMPQLDGFVYTITALKHMYRFLAQQDFPVI